MRQGTLHDAAFQGDLDKLREILAEGQDVNAYPPAWKSVYQPTALAYAVWGNQPAAVRLLLDGGADPNQPDGVRGWAACAHSSPSSGVTR